VRAAPAPVRTLLLARCDCELGRADRADTPFLDELALDWCPTPTVRAAAGWDWAEPHFEWAEPVLAAATRLTRLEVYDLCFEGPPPMIAAGRTAILAFQADDPFLSSRRLASGFDGALALLRAASAALPGVAAEPPVAAHLELKWLSNFKHIGWQGLDAPGELSRAFAGFGQNLTRLAVGNWNTNLYFPTRDCAKVAEVANAVAGLLRDGVVPALRELLIDWNVSLADVHAPPAGLTFLFADVERNNDVLLSPAVRAGLACLAVDCDEEGDPGPPRCLRGAGASFGRLTRLVYGTLYATTINLTWWCRPDFSLPTLVELEAVGANFAAEGWDRRTFCASFLAGLPSLARLTLWATGGVLGRGRVLNLPPFAASIHMGKSPAAVRAIVTAGLPRAALDAGRHLAVVVHHVRDRGRVRALASRFGLDDYRPRREEFGSLSCGTGAGRPDFRVIFL
jgi:hypothetical protein